MITITDVATGRWIKITDGLPYMIGYYGFYEGSVPWRVSPKDMIDLIEGKP